ncbi:hypothetical protein IL306_003590 [Fusarium sp. DS 682]|nr:hypothetical protein IL306_003590 [Fusarium sp. DS 682]
MPESKKLESKARLRHRFKRLLGGSSTDPNDDAAPSTTRQQSENEALSSAEPGPPAGPKALELKGLWKEAYDQLQKDDAEIVDAYKSALSRQCAAQKEEESLPPGEDSETTDLRGFIKARLDEIQASHLTVTIAGKSIGIKEQARRAVHAILSVKDFISAAVNSEPHAALAWAGVLVLLVPISKSFTQEEDAVDGFERISGILVRYRVIECTHIEVPVDKNGSSSDGLVEDLEASIKEETVKLYAMILKYQMRLLKHFSRSGFFRWMKDVTVADDWKGMFDAILEVEKAIDLLLGALRGHILRKIETGVGQLSEQLESARQTMIEARDEARTAKQDSLLNSLPIASDAAFNSWGDQHKARCLDGTQISTLTRIQDWKESSNRETIYWLRGMAGTGKSTISRTLAAACHDQKAMFSGPSCQLNSHTFLGASFFFDRTKPDRNNASRLVTTICRQIATTIHDIKGDICDSISKHPSIGTQSLDDQWEYLVVHPLRSLGSRTLVPLTLIIIIDALDECEGEADLAAFLQLVAQAPPLVSISLKFFITSRPEAHVRINFGTMTGISVFEDELHKVALTPDKLTSEHKDDITRYLEHKLTRITAKSSIDDWPGMDNLVKLARKSDGLFIFASTACLFLGGAKGRVDRLDMRLNMIFSDKIAEGSPQKSLDGIYTRILRFSVIGDAIDEEKDMICGRFRLIVGSIIVLFEPLTVSALGHLLGESVSTVEGTLGELYSVLAMGDEQLPIQLLHLSFRDFLVKSARCIDSDFLVSERKTHTALFRRCLTLLTGALKQNICDLPSPTVCAADIEYSKLCRYLPQDVQYACRYWVDHMLKAQIEPCDGDEVHLFLVTHLLHWLEALSLIRKLSTGIVAVRNLSKYISALQKSIIRQQYESKIPKWIRRVPDVKADWDTLLQTLPDGNELQDLALSRDGKRVASSSGRVWDTETGALLRTFQPLGQGFRVTFSLDGHAVMSISKEGHVRVWDVASGLLLHEVVRSVDTPPLPEHLFSADSTLAIITSCTLTFQVIDLQNGTRLQNIQGPEQPLLCVALSNNDILLASGSIDGLVRVWNVQTGVLQHELSGHNHAIWRLVFSADDTVLVSVSDDKTAKAWNLTRGEQQAVLGGEFLDMAFLIDSPSILLCSDGNRNYARSHLWDVSSNEYAKVDGLDLAGIRLSSDGTRVVSVKVTRGFDSVNPGSIIFVRNMDSGELDHWLEGHTGNILNAFFSADNALLASASNDGTIRLWDLSAQGSPERFDSHSGAVTTIELSPDLRVAASCAFGDRIRLWDVESGSVRQTFEGEAIMSPFFSPDGTFFLVLLGKHVQVWDIATGNLVRSINCYSSGVLPAALSPDGRILAVKYWHGNMRRGESEQAGSIDDDGKGHTNVDKDELRLFGSGEPHVITPTTLPPAVGLWDLTTGALLHVCPGISVDEGCLAFSPDGQTLAFGPRYTGMERIDIGGWIAVWDIQGAGLMVLGEYVQALTDLAWSPDGKLLAATIRDDKFKDQIQIWNVTTRTMSRSFELDHRPHDLSFTPDGERLLTVSPGGIYRLWAVTTGALIGQRSAVWGDQWLRFSEDGKTIDTGVNRLALASFYPGWKPTDATEFYLSGNWIHHGNAALLLPDDDPPTCAAGAGDVLIMGHKSGRVTFLEIGDGS